MVNYIITHSTYPCGLTFQHRPFCLRPCSLNVCARVLSQSRRQSSQSNSILSCAGCELTSKRLGCWPESWQGRGCLANSLTYQTCSKMPYSIKNNKFQQQMEQPLHFSFSRKIQSKNLTFKILGYYSTLENLEPASLLSRGLNKLIAKKANKPSKMREVPSLLLYSQQHDQNQQSIDTDQKLVNLSTANVELNLNPISEVIRLSYERVALTFESQTQLIIFNVRSQEVESITDLLSLVEAGIVHKQKKKSFSLFSLKKKSEEYGVERIAPMFSDNQVALVVKITNINKLYTLDLGDRYRPKVASCINLMEEEDVMCMIQLQRPRAFLLTQDSANTLTLWHQEHKQQLFGLQRALPLHSQNSNAHLLVSNWKGPQRYECFKVEKHKACHSKLHLQGSRQSLVQLRFKLFEEDAYQKPQKALVAALYNECHLVVVDLVSCNFQPFYTIKLSNPSNVVDLSPETFLVTSQKTVHIINKDKVFTVSKEFVGASFPINNVVQMKMTHLSSITYIICYNSSALKQVTWAVDTSSGETQFIHRLELLKPLSCLKSIGKLSKDECLLMGGLAAGNNLSLVTFKVDQ